MKALRWWCPGLLLAASCGTEPDQPPSLGHIVAGAVFDSLGAPVMGVPIGAALWRQDDSISWGYGESDGAGVYSIEWFAAVAHDYDSLVVVSIAIDPCRPYSSVRVALTPDQLRALPSDSIHVRIRLGLAREAPTFAAGLFACAVAHKPLGEFTTDFQLELGIENGGTTSGDSVEGTWRILFSETRRPLEGAFLGAVTNDTLVLALHMAADNYVECEPGYRLRIALEEQRLGDGQLETLRPDVPVCSVEQLDPLRFVASQPALFEMDR